MKGGSEGWRLALGVLVCVSRDVLVVCVVVGVLIGCVNRMFVEVCVVVCVCVSIWEGGGGTCDLVTMGVC